MKILVFSDSHGNVDNMTLAVERERPNRIFHLGDGWQDAERLRDMFPDIPLDQVPGNCDFRFTEPAVKLVQAGGKRILLCHGHTYRVKEGLMDVGYAAREQKADLLCFGHTHIPTQEWAGESLLLNPGSIGYWGKPTYAVVKIEDGRLTADLRKLV
jgi:putative phosphoesterase